MQKDSVRDDGMLLDHIGIGGGYVAKKTAKTLPKKAEEEISLAADMDELVRTLKEQGAEIVFEGTRPDGTPRRF